jgi:peptidoglycan hydrolase-like protein with peptidoglycan-binding domain
MPDPSAPLNRPPYTRRRFLVLSAGVVVPAAVYSAFRSSAAGPSETEIAVDGASALGATSAAPDVVASIPESSTPATQTNAIVFDHAVGPGSTGEKVVALQDRLRALAFDPGPSDGVFGPATERAVWAFEKFFDGVALDQVTGQVSPERWTRMSGAFDVRPRRAGPGTHVEVLLPSQIAVVYRANVPVLITHVSSGTGEEWCSVVKVDEDDGTQTEQAICGVAVTPGGVFHFDRRVEGWRESKLGRLYNPVYFNYGIAIHGATNVPAKPASRGCVRIPMHIAEYFPSLVANGDLVYVFDGVEQPETYGAQLPVFDYPDPTATTTTSTTTTTAPPSTTTTVHAHASTTSVPASLPPSPPAPPPASTVVPESG